MKTVQVTHPSGCPMPFTENILTFIHVRKSGHKFNIGEWLSTLGEDFLQKLANIAEDVMLYGPAKEISPDLLICVKSGYEAETSIKFQGLEIEQCIKILSVFCLAVLLEQIQRHGWIEIINDLSLDPQGAVEYRITEEGMRNKDAFSKFLH